MPRLLIVAIVLAGILAGAATAQYFWRAQGTPPELEQAVLFSETRALPAFALLDQAGRPFGPEQLRGHWTLLFFGFVNCPDICPTTLARLRSLHAARDGALKSARVVLISVDGDRDTPERLKAYLAPLSADFIGLTGDPKATSKIAARFAAVFFKEPAAKDGSYTVDHSAAIFLVNPEGRIAALFGTPHEAGTIARDFRRIVAAR